MFQNQSNPFIVRFTKKKNLSQIFQKLVQNGVNQATHSIVVKKDGLKSWHIFITYNPKNFNFEYIIIKHRVENN